MPTSSQTYVRLICTDEPFFQREFIDNAVIEARKILGDQADLTTFTPADLAKNAPGLAALDALMSTQGLLFADAGEDKHIIKIYIDKLNETSYEVCKTIAADLHDGLFVILALPYIQFAPQRIHPRDPHELQRRLSFADVPAVDSLPKKSKSKAKKSTTAKKSYNKENEEKQRFLQLFSYFAFHNNAMYSMDRLSPDDLPSWVRHQAQRYQLRISNNEATTLSLLGEQNLLNIDQFLQTMELMLRSQDQAHGDKPPFDPRNPNTWPELTKEHISTYFCQDARHDENALVSAIVEGNNERAINVIETLTNTMSMTEGLMRLVQVCDKFLSCILELQSSSSTHSSYLVVKYPFALTIPNFVQRINQYTKDPNNEKTLNMANLCVAEADTALINFDLMKAKRALQRFVFVMTKKTFSNEESAIAFSDREMGVY